MSADSYQPIPADAGRTLDAALEQLGLRLDDAGRAAAAAAFAQALRVERGTGRLFAVDADGVPMLKVEDGRAVDMGALDLARELAERHGAGEASSSTSPAAPASTASGLTAKMAAHRAQEAASLRQQAEAAAAAQGNPWVSRTSNLTLRMAISRHAPELAAKLKREAGQ